MQHKYTQELDRQTLLDLLAVSRDQAPADLRIDNVKIMNLVSGGYLDGPIVIKHGYIVGFGAEYKEQPASQVIDAQGKVAVPGFFDAHLHIESSLMTPQTFEAATLPKGVTTIVCDPHEIVNVMGSQGMDWFVNSASQAIQNQFVQVSSCVPALPGCEVNGAEFTLEQMATYRNHPHVLGLAEMMNFPGVVHGDALVLDKLAAFAGLTRDGHAPMVRGRTLDAYISGGINNDHECTTYEEACEKLAKGLTIFIREGSAARNLNALAPILNEYSSAAVCLCTDDRNPYEIAHEGHIDSLIRRLINQHQVAPHVAYRAASLTPANHFGLKRLGLIAPGRKADIVLLNDVEQVDIAQVFIGGKDVASLDLVANAHQRYLNSNPPAFNTIVRNKVEASEFALNFAAGKKYHAIRVIHNEIITGSYVVTCTGVNAQGQPTFDQDCCLITVLERYGKQTKPAIALLTGSGLQTGALASSVGHDSHNIVAIGANPEELATAVNAIIDTAGGFSVVQGQQVTAHLDLPIAGLLSPAPAAQIEEQIEKLKTAALACGLTLEEPFIQLSFLSLPVIPSLKLTCNGLFDVNQFKFVELEIQD
ncbi:adenine deaminase [Psittacicella hinzii]|uniref:Adenine deaminase n=1 Tax=Psittacicella hinzii TaxID=2028575 RepID=A0A3A1YNM1_9GAMM|nr:adenine deaminase [Psittacicella hinzii]RIY39873.1 adenine deaminase [Psittacicella hinzii]